MQPFGTVPAVVDGDYKIFGKIFKKISVSVLIVSIIRSISSQNNQVLF